MPNAEFRFYQALNAFLPPHRRQRSFGHPCAGNATVKHVIEALGVPHTEVELILVNGTPVDFSHHLQDGDRVAVYPRFESIDVTPLLRVWAPRPLISRFIADAHLGGLARLLRMSGFDTLYDNHFADAEIERLAATGERIVLTRDRDLLKRRDIRHGCYVHHQQPIAQAHEIIQRLDLSRDAHPFTLCLECNAPLRPLARAEALPRVPPAVALHQQHFSTCDCCSRVFWEGSHWQHMRAVVSRLLASSPP